MIVACVALLGLTLWLIISSSEGWLGSTWMRFVDGEVVRYLIVGADSAWVAHNEGWRAVLALVFNEILDIILGELSIETLFHILNFLCLDWVIIIGCGLINKSLVKSRLEEKIEVGHESSIVTILVLCEDRVQSVEYFS